MEAKTEQLIQNVNTNERGTSGHGRYSPTL